MAHPQEWHEFCQKRWESGYKPSRIIKELRDEYGHTLKYTTMKTWADDEGWKYFEDSDTPKELNPNLPAGVSGISDPIYHLSLVLGKRMIRENSATRSTDTKEFGTRPSTIVAEALEMVDNEYDPGPKALTYLKPVLTRYVHSIRRASESRASRANLFNEDPKRNIKSRNRLDAITTEAVEEHRKSQPKKETGEE